MKLMAAKAEFERVHPKFASFLSKIVSDRMVEEGSIIEITITKNDGTTVTGNMKVQNSDIRLMEELRSLASNQRS